MDRTQPAVEALDWTLDQLELRGQVLFLRARPLACLKGRLQCVQTNILDYQQLQQQGYHPVLKPEGSFAGALVLGTPFKEENLANLAIGFDHLESEGLLLCSLANDLGAASLEKQLKQNAEEILTFSKRKCRVFGCRRRQLFPAALESWRRHAGLRRSEVTGLWTCPGIFGWNKVDLGSQLLGDVLPEDLTGSGADLGAGNGYLSKRALEKNPGVDSLHLFEAEHLALEAARLNLEGSRPKLVFCWQDVPAGLPQGQFDWVIVNPPFHQAARRNLNLGLAFIEQAARTLRSGGQLWMVCNQTLPYEEPLEELFASHHRVALRDGFKVLRAVRS